MLVGVVFIIVVTTLVDIALHMADVYPPMGRPLNDVLALLATSYRIVIGIAGAWLTARLAPHAPMKHALALVYVGTVLGIALAVLAIPQCWAGGRLYARCRRQLRNP